MIREFCGCHMNLQKPTPCRHENLNTQGLSPILIFQHKLRFAPLGEFCPNCLFIVITTQLDLPISKMASFPDIRDVLSSNELDERLQLIDGVYKKIGHYYRQRFGLCVLLFAPISCLRSFPTSPDASCEEARVRYTSAVTAALSVDNECRNGLPSLPCSFISSKLKVKKV